MDGCQISIIKQIIPKYMKCKQKHAAVDKWKASWVDEVLSKSQSPIWNLESASPQYIDEENTDFTTTLMHQSQWEVLLH